MPTKQKGSPPSPSARERNVWDVAREAFENSLIEGDAAASREPRRRAQTEQQPG